MKHKLPSHISGLTLAEALVLIGVIVILATLSTPYHGGNVTKAQLAQAVSNARQIHNSSVGAAADSSAQNDRTIGWPADVRPIPPNTGRFIQTLVTGDYLNFGDLKVFGADKMVYRGEGAFDPQRHCGFKIYNVSDEDDGNTIFLTSKNVTISEAGGASQMDAGMKDIFGDTGFVVFRKEGDGTYYLKAKPRDGKYGTQPRAARKILAPDGLVYPPSK